MVSEEVLAAPRTVACMGLGIRTGTPSTSCLLKDLNNQYSTILLQRLGVSVSFISANICITFQGKKPYKDAG